MALAFAREGADVLISYLTRRTTRRETARGVEAAGRKCVLVAGDIADEAHCRAIIDRAVKEFGKVDILVNNAAFQMTREALEEITDEEFDRTLKTNLYAMFWLEQGGRPAHARRAASVINTSSIQADKPEPAAAALRDDQGGDPELHRRPGPDARQEGHPGELRRPRARSGRR